MSCLRNTCRVAALVLIVAGVCALPLQVVAEPAGSTAPLEALTERTITDRTVLEAELAEIRRRGYAETVDELEHGFSGVGAVVRGRMGDVLGALSICGPTQRLSEPRRSQLGMILMDAAERLQPR